jgi:predicted phosphohydrolase
MSVWALADLHLSFGVPDKNMDVFGDKWKNHPEKIQTHWLANIQQDDLVLLPGDISWAMHTEEVKPDLDWIEALPGTKVMLRGNHDYWWTSLSKIKKVLPPSIHVIQNNSYVWKDVVVGGSRLWDTPEYSFQRYIDFQDNPRTKKLTVTDNDLQEAEKIFERELGRLEASLKTMTQAPSAAKRIAITHYPPIGAELHASRAAALLTKYGIDVCVFGHLHNIKHEALSFGTKDGVRYILASGDYLDFLPVKIL